MVSETPELASSRTICSDALVAPGVAVSLAWSPLEPQPEAGTPARASASSTKSSLVVVNGQGGGAGPTRGARGSYRPRETENRAQSPAARRAAACAASSSASSSGGSSAGARPSAVAVSQSANQEFLGSNGPWRYVPSTVPC